MELVILWLGLAVVTSIAAASRGRSATGWFFLGFLFSGLALIAVLVMPNLAQTAAPARATAPAPTSRPAPSGHIKTYKGRSIRRSGDLIVADGQEFNTVLEAERYIDARLRITGETPPPAPAPVRIALDDLVMDITYENAQGKISQRTIQPLNISSGPSAPILYAYCRTARSMRAFRTDRIAEVVDHDGEILDIATYLQRHAGVDISTIPLAPGTSPREHAHQGPQEASDAGEKDDLTALLDTASPERAEAAVRAAESQVLKLSKDLIEHLKSGKKATAKLYALLDRGYELGERLEDLADAPGTDTQELAARIIAAEEMLDEIIEAAENLTDQLP